MLKQVLEVCCKPIQLIAKLFCFVVSTVRFKSGCHVTSIFFTFLLFNSVVIQGQSDDVKFKKLNIGLSDNSVHAIFEDYKGYMWFGSESGIDRFDGINIVSYSKILGDNSSLSNNKVICIYEDSKQNLWIGTINGLNLYDRQKDVFIRYYFSKEEKHRELHNYVNIIIEDDEGTIWLGTNGGVCILESEKKQFSSFQKYVNKTINIDIEVTTALMLDNENRIFAGTKVGSVYQYNKKTGEVDKYLFDNGTVNANIRTQIWDISQTNDGLFWITTSGQGLFKVKKMDDGHIWYENFRHNPDNNNSLSRNNLQSFCASKNGELWLGGINGGLTKFDYKKNVFNRYLFNPFELNTVSGNSIWDVFIDSKDRLWISVFNSGIDLVDKSTELFASYHHNNNKLNSLTHSSVAAFLEDSIGNVWIATDGGGVDYWNRKTDVFTHFKHDKNDPTSIGSDAALCFLKTKSGDIWIGTFSGGISVLKKGQRKFKRINLAEGLPSSNIFSMVQGENNTIYIGTLGGGLSIYDEKSKQFTNFQHDPLDTSGISDNHITTLWLDSDKNLWIGYGETGLDLMEVDDDGKVKFTKFRNSPDDPTSLSDNSLMTIFEDSKKNIWVATRGGLNKFNKETRKFKVYSKLNGFPHNTIVGIQEDNSGKLWISSLNGLSSFEPETEKIKNYTVNDGLQGMQFNNRSSYYTNKMGEFFFGGNDGFTVFHPDSLKYDRHFPNIYFSDFKIFNKKVEVGIKGSPLESHISETKELTLSYKQSVFTIEYVALNYSHREKNQYAYKLVGFEKDWNYVGTKRTATYTNLDAGEYIFKVISTNNEGDWNEESLDLKITITPPFWKTWWFISIILFSIISSALIFYWIKVTNVKKHNEQLEKLVKDRTLKLVETNLILEEKQDQVLNQKEEVEAQKDKILKQNEELKLHRNHLEDLVLERTNELLLAKEKAEESDKLKTSFLTNISHEIRTPLNAIIGYSSLLEDPAFEAESNQEFINYIRKNSDRLLNLVDNILDLAKIETTKLQIEHIVFNVPDFLNDTYNYWTLNNDIPQVKLRRTDGEKANDTCLKSDKYRIRQVLDNLISNALKFTEKGYVDIGYETNESSLIFYVKDTGIGISAANCKVIFESFRKIEENKEKLYRGTGMGLAISRRLAEIIGGKLWADSTPGEGSSFYFTLPYNPNNVEKKSAEVKQSKLITNWKGRRILIVEDDKASLLYLRQVFQRNSVESTWAVNGKAAVELFQAGKKFDMVLMDIKMPILDGYEATRMIKEIDPNQLIIAQTAYARRGNEKAMIEAGFDDFTAKPIKSRYLLSLLKKYFI